MTATSKEPSRATVFLDLPSDLLELVGDEDVPRLIQEFLLNECERWFSVLESYSGDARGTVDESTIDIPDAVEMLGPLSGKMEVHWEEFLPTGCRDFDLAGLEHHSMLDFNIIPETGQIQLIGAVNEVRSTCDEF